MIFGIDHKPYRGIEISDFVSKTWAYVGEEGKEFPEACHFLTLVRQGDIVYVKKFSPKAKDFAIILVGMVRDTIIGRLVQDSYGLPPGFLVEWMFQGVEFFKENWCEPFDGTVDRRSRFPYVETQFEIQDTVVNLLLRPQEFRCLDLNKIQRNFLALERRSQFAIVQ